MVSKSLEEMMKYDIAAIDHKTSEIDEYDSSILRRIIRHQQLEIINSVFKSIKPQQIVEIGCGAGWFLRRVGIKRMKFVGIDISYRLMERGRSESNNISFVQSDAHNLPFKKGSFELAVGIGVLHHLNDNAVLEMSRVASVVLFMEPNILNFLHSMGRKFFPMKTHTSGEKQYLPSHFKRLFLNAGFNIIRFEYRFPFSFLIGRALKY